MMDVMDVTQALQHEATRREELLWAWNDLAEELLIKLEPYEQSFVEPCKTLRRLVEETNEELGS